MKERQACWGARDEYWKCLDENEDDASQCKKLRRSFESSCPQQWVSHAWTCFSLLLKYTEGTVRVADCEMKAVLGMSSQQVNKSTEAARGRENLVWSSWLVLCPSIRPTSGKGHLAL